MLSQSRRGKKGHFLEGGGGGVIEGIIARPFQYSLKVTQVLKDMCSYSISQKAVLMVYIYLSFSNCWSKHFTYISKVD